MNSCIIGISCFFCVLILVFIICTCIIRKRSERFSSDTTTDRKDFYLGNLKKDINVKHSDINWSRRKLFVIDENVLHTTDNVINKYIEEMTNYFRGLRRKKVGGDLRILLLPGDVIHSYDNVPVISKTRPIDKPGLNVLLPLNNGRHWKPVGDALRVDKTPWDMKRDTIVWRGIASGRDKRVPLVENWRNFPYKEQIDVAFTSFLDAYEGDKDNTLLGDKIQMRDLLSNKFLISVEGNDVASNLKWILATQTVCIMPEPTIESWLMESRLKPWIHYVPVKHDFSDLLGIYRYCVDNPQEMKKIIKNANNYMEQFNDQEKEEELVIDILKDYTDKVNLMF